MNLETNDKKADIIRKAFILDAAIFQFSHALWEMYGKQIKELELCEQERFTQKSPPQKDLPF